jgi:hypothetical protein
MEVVSVIIWEPGGEETLLGADEVGTISRPLGLPA